MQQGSAMSWILPFALSLALFVGESFDPSRDLKGYDEAAISEWSDLYDFDYFRALKGKKFSAEEMAALRETWEDEKKRAAKKIEAIRSNPLASFERQVRRLADGDRFLSSVPFTTRKRPSALLFIQSPPKPDPGYVPRVEEFYGPLLDALVQHFDSAYAKPLGLERRNEIPSVALFILASEGAYDDYMRSKPGMTRHPAQVAHYDSEYRFALTFERGTAVRTFSDTELRNLVLHESVHALTDAYSRFGNSRIQSLWLVEGFAEYLSRFRPDPRSGAVTFGHVDKDDLSTYLKASQTPAVARALLPPLADLVATKGYDDVVSAAVRRAKVAGVQLSEEQKQLALVLFYTASHLFVDFLHHGEGGRHRGGFLAYLKGVMAGEAASDALLSALGIERVDVLEAAYREHVEARLAGRDVTRSAPSFEAAGAAPAHVALLLPPRTPKEAMGLALRAARQGEVHASLAAARAAPADADDVKCLEALVKLSDDLLDSVKKGGKNLVVTGPSGGTGTVHQFDEKVIVLLDHQKRPKTIPRAAFTPKQMVEWIRKRNVPLGTPELLASALVLAGEPVTAAVNSAGAAGPAVQARADRWASYERVSDARERLERLASCAQSLPDDPAPALEDLDALFDRHRDVEAIARNRAALLDLGSRLLEKQAERTITDAFHGFQGKFARVPDGQVEIAYDFSSPAQLSDFAPSPEYAKDIVVNFFEPHEIRPERSPWRISAGKLTTSGCASLFHRARFAGACSMEVTLRIVAVSQVENQADILLLGLCDDGLGSFGALLPDYRSLVIHRRNPKGEAQKPFEEALYIGRPYVMRIEHADSRFIASIGSTTRVEMPDLNVSSGRAFLVTQGSNEYEISNLVIRGRPDPAATQALRAAWVAERRAKWEAAR
jgi:hypothetical protein